MLAHKMMLSGQEGGIEFTFTVQTGATSAGEKKAAIPLNLYGQTDASVKVDWGDGTVSVLKASDYAADDSTASIHEYASAGTYTVTASSPKWEDIYFISCYVDGSISSTNNANLPIYIWRRTLVSLDSPFPPVKGVKKLDSVTATAMTASDGDLGYFCHRCEKMTSIPADLFVHCAHLTVFTAIFYHCAIMTSIPAGLLDPLVNAVDLSQFFRYWIALKSVPEGLFDKCVNVVNMQETFRYCQTLETIPAGLFRYNTLVTNMLGMFRVCNMLKSFKLCIGSPSVNTVSDFIVNASNVTRIVCVPANSTTCTTFNSYKNTSNNIIVSTDLNDCIGVEVEEPEEWQFTIDTEATTAGEKKTGIPFNLYGQDGITLTVDWGDNTTSTLTPSNYTARESTASVHEYATAGEYTVTIASSDWENTYLLFYDSAISLDSGNQFSSLYWFKRTATSIDTKLPKIKGVVDADTQTAYNNSLRQVFYNLVKITSIPSGLFDNNTEVTEFFATFSRCISLTSIPSGLFDSNTEVTSFSNCFDGCSSLQSIPSGLFDNNTAATVFWNCFYGCSSLQSIPSGLFDKNTAATIFYGCFQNCTSIQSIPSGLFDNNTAATSFIRCFYGCSSLQSIPSGLFNNNTAVTSFNSCFYGCINLLDFHLKIGSSLVQSFNTFIPNASNVDRIICVPANSTTYTTVSSYANSYNNIIVSTDYIDCTETWEFTINTEATTAGEKKTGIPFNLYGQTGIELLVDWGDNTTSTLTPSDYTANDSTASVHEYAAAGEYTVTIASNDWENTYLLFYSYGISSDSNTKTSSFYWFRRTATSIDTTLPQIKGIVDADTRTAHNNSLQCLFFLLKKLTSIPSGLFDKNTQVTSFGSCFYECNSLQSIPSGLFDKNIEVTTFSGCFYGCTSLQSIPSGLFDKNTEVTSFSYCFYRCTSIAFIPSGLFDKNTQVTSFGSCFSVCNSIQSIPSGLFDNNTAVTYFGYCFWSCISLQSIPSGLFDKNTQVTSFQSCFNGCTSLQSIPSGLFDNNVAVTTFDYCFYDCTLLADFTLNIGSALVTSITEFVIRKSGTTRIINVPANSATYTTFSNATTYLGLTIVGV